MNRQTYPVHCGWCNTVVRTDGPVEGSTGICPACLAELRKEADRQFEHSVRCADCGRVIRSRYEPVHGTPLCFDCISARDKAPTRDESCVSYPVKCSCCGLMMPQTSSVAGVTGICERCASSWRQAAWADECDEDRRRLIDEAWRGPSSFMDGFLIGGAVAILLGILAEWLMHR